MRNVFFYNTFNRRLRGSFAGIMAHQYLTAAERVKAHTSGCRWLSITKVCDEFVREGTSPSVWTAIEEATRGQKENPVWHTMQNGVVMAFDFKNVIEGMELLRSSDVSEGYVTNPIMERKVKFQSIAAKKWEVALEKEALDKYWQKRLSKTRSNLPTELKRTGIIMSRSHPLVGASPHAIVYTKHNPRPLCVVLVKRSYLDRNKHPKEVEQGEVDHAPNKRLCIGQGHRWFCEAQARWAWLESGCVTSSSLQTKESASNVWLPTVPSMNFSKKQFTNLLRSTFMQTWFVKQTIIIMMGQALPITTRPQSQSLMKPQSQSLVRSPWTQSKPVSCKMNLLIEILVFHVYSYPQN